MFYLVVILSVFTASVAQMLLKKGASQPHGSFLKEYLNPWVIGGYALLGLSLVVNVWALSKGIQVKEVSILESLSYLFVPVLSYLCFKERLNWKKAASIAIILVGILIFFA
jgi:drug/metabolite transporter (DMT)-like permease